ncbi:MAG: hypothetical protein ACI8TQ_000718 [Planctomycetota bacterium]|jgi:hypothetical protein
MKRKVLIGSLLWGLLLTLAHIQLNVGWSKLKENVDVFLGEKRRELTVGFLPVT